jgi:hypothetical protein
MVAMTSTEMDLPATLTPAERKVLKQFESEITAGFADMDRAGALIGKALWDIQEESLWRAGYETFADYALGRWGLSRSKAYRLVQIAKEVAAHPGAPIPKQWQLEPGKVARKEVGSSPTRGTVPAAPEPSQVPVIDAEWSDEDEPSLPPAWAAAAQLPPDPPVVVAEAKAAIEDDESSIGHVTEHWAPTPLLDRAGVTEQRVGRTWPSDHHFPTDPAAVATMIPPGFAPVDRTAGAIEALMDLFESIDLEKVGAAMTAEQIETFGMAFEMARDAHAIATKPREKLSKGQRAKASVRAITAPSSAPLDRTTVEPRFKVAK